MLFRSNAQFDLQGSATSGALRLFSPLGTTLAQVNWRPRAARLLSRGEAQDFADLDALMTHLLGINLPSEALFAWLRGEAATATGWQVDLGEHANGRISAARLAAPKAQLTVLFEAHSH